MILIDTLIHEFHRLGPARRALAVCLIRGKLAEVEALIEGLAYGQAALAPMLGNRRRWLKDQHQRQEWLKGT